MQQLDKNNTQIRTKLKYQTIKHYGPTHLNSFENCAHVLAMNDKL